MNPTLEQQKIVDVASAMQKNQILTVQAFAGAGKTSTLVYLTQVLSQKKFLYLAFNKAIVMESKKKFGKNVSIYTTHSLAYMSILGDKKVKLRDDYKPAEIAEYFSIDLSSAIEALQALNAFFNSSDQCIVSSNMIAKQTAQKLYNKMCKFELPITHSFYLKLYQLRCESYSEILKMFDYVLLDEAQDTNEVTLDIFMKFDAAKILVGDTHQAIYSFRNKAAIDAMSCVKSDYRLNLTTTFRCSSGITQMANIVLSCFKNEKERIVSMAAGGEPKNKSFAVICRTNATIIFVIAKAIDYNASNPKDEVRYRLLRSPESIFNKAINIYYFLENKYEKIYPEFKYLTKFKSKQALEGYIADSKDLDLKSSFSLANRYRGYLFVLFDKAKEFYRSKDGDFLITAHTSKGLEFDEVMLLSDFPKLSELRFLNDPSLIEETNLYYVAVTRAKWFIEDKTKNKEYIKGLFK
ncbi:hypothetical protein A9K75_06575 [Campylobacter fetus subsp. testudinum]|uniref:UvrD-helicase domain-containing protein n=1 Tax=Campylobacter fetus TaxID=196 RepID=UPI0008188DFC|nr:UvrD-helicase domain-containing protein [Campylobacter fetus]OCR99530.1 hypothetical protein A9K75_06575 [Campylobacter fetus subsp. testudinum]